MKTFDKKRKKINRNCLNVKITQQKVGAGTLASSYIHQRSKCLRVIQIYFMSHKSPHMSENLI